VPAKSGWRSNAIHTVGAKNLVIFSVAIVLKTVAESGAAMMTLVAPR